MESGPESKKNNDFEEFSRRLIELSLADEIIPGKEISTEDFSLAREGDSLIQTLINSVVRYVSAPTLLDHFTSHEEERIPAFNESGIFGEFDTKLYMNNRLRLNKISGLLVIVEIIAKRNKRFPEGLVTKAADIVDRYDLKQYDYLDNRTKLAFTERLAEDAEALLEEAVNVGLVVRQ